MDPIEIQLENPEDLMDWEVPEIFQAVSLDEPSDGMSFCGTCHDGGL